MSPEASRGHTDSFIRRVSVPVFRCQFCVTTITYPIGYVIVVVKKYVMQQKYRSKQPAFQNYKQTQNRPILGRFFTNLSLRSILLLRGSRPVFPLEVFPNGSLLYIISSTETQQMACLPTIHLPSG